MSSEKNDDMFSLISSLFYQFQLFLTLWSDLEKGKCVMTVFFSFGRPFFPQKIYFRPAIRFGIFGTLVCPGGDTTNELTDVGRHLMR